MRNLYLGWFIVAASFVLGEDDLKRWSNSNIEVCERSGLSQLPPPLILDNCTRFTIIAFKYILTT